MDRQAPYLREMGLVRWRFGSGGGGRSESEPGSPPSGADVGGGDETPGLLSLAEKARHCERCELHRTRGKVVFGSGSPGARWFFVGEAPGAEEDKQGAPFVGRAGALLNAMLLAIGLSRESVYIANVLKCRPPNNRDPFGLEVQECSPFLHAQIELIQPQIIVAMGRFAAQALLNSAESLAQLRGKAYPYRLNQLPLVVTYHPAYLLRSPAAKSKTWEDLVLAQSLLT